MKYELFKQVSLLVDFPEKNLKKGDVATIVDHHPVPDGKDGYTLEVFNVFGETYTLLTVRESEIEPLNKNEIFNARSLSA